LIKRILSIAAIAIITTGCAHKSMVSSVEATNIYSSYDDKIQGSFVYVVDDTSVSKLQVANTVQGFQCSAHKFPIDATSAFKASFPKFLDNIFETIQPANSADGKDLSTVVFRSERFQPSLRFIAGFMSADASATVEMAMSASVTGKNGKIFSTMVDTSRTKMGDAGGFCEGGSLVLADATRDAMKDVLEKMGERLTNAPKLRAAASK